MSRENSGKDGAIREGKRWRTHDVVTGVVEVLEERRAAPSVSEDDDGRQTRVMRELLSRVTLVVTAPDDVAAAENDADEDGPGERPDAVLGLFRRRRRLGTGRTRARRGRLSRRSSGRRRRDRDGRSAFDDGRTGVQRRRRRRVGRRGLLDEVRVLEPVGLRRSERERGSLSRVGGSERGALGRGCFTKALRSVIELSSDISEKIRIDRD